MTPTPVRPLGDLLVTDSSAGGRIAGATVRDVRVNRDPRGTLTELLRADWPDVYGEDMPFAQVSTSTTGLGVARDEDKWHVHYPDEGRTPFAQAGGTLPDGTRS